MTLRDEFDDLGTKLLHLNASGIPQGAARYARWANKGEVYPYGEQYPTLGSPSRVVNFIERKHLWSPGPPPGIWEATAELIREKCGESPFEIPYTEKTVGEVLKETKSGSQYLLRGLLEKRLGHMNYTDADLLCIRPDGGVHSPDRGEWFICPHEAASGKDGATWRRLLREAGMLPSPEAAS